MELKVQLHWISLYIQMQWEDEGRRAQDNFLIWEQILSYGMKLQEHVSRITHSSLLRTWQETRERETFDGINPRESPKSFPLLLLLILLCPSIGSHLLNGKNPFVLLHWMAISIHPLIPCHTLRFRILSTGSCPVAVHIQCLRGISLWWESGSRDSPWYAMGPSAKDHLFAYIDQW